MTERIDLATRLRLSDFRLRFQLRRDKSPWLAERLGERARSKTGNETQSRWKQVLISDWLRFEVQKRWKGTSKGEGPLGEGAG